jgi:O-Antigen ligase
VTETGATQVLSATRPEPRCRRTASPTACAGYNLTAVGSHRAQWMAGTYRLPERLWQIAVAVTGAVAVGCAAAMSLPIAVLLAASPLAIAALRSSRARLLIVAFGALLVFDTSKGFTPYKLAYLAVFVPCVAAAWYESVAMQRDERTASVRLAVGMAWWLMVAVVVISWPVAKLNGNSTVLWLRDSAPYLFLGAIPIIALDASRRIGPRFVTAAFVVAALAATASVCLQVATFHHVAEGSLGQLPVYTGFVLPTVAVAYSCGRALRPLPGRHDLILWSLLGGLIVGAIILSGTRSGVLLLLIPLTVLVTGGVRNLRRVLVLGAVTCLLVVGALAVGGAAGLSLGAVPKRLVSVATAVSSPGANSSLAERFRENGVAWKIFRADPILGRGPGQVFTWPATPRGPIKRSFTMDGSLSVLAKFGVLGSVGLIVFFALVGRAAWRSANQEVQAALAGLLVWAAAYFVIGNPFNDKGLAVGMLFLLALAFQGATEARATTKIPDPRRTRGPVGSVGET